MCLHWCFRTTDNESTTEKKVHLVLERMNKLKWKTAEIVEKEERVSSEAVLSLIEWGVSDSCFIC